MRIRLPIMRINPTGPGLKAFPPGLKGASCWDIVNGPRKNKNVLNSKAHMMTRTRILCATLTIAASLLHIETAQSQIHTGANTITGTESSVAGGDSNGNGGNYSTIGGGQSNTNGSDYVVIGGGAANEAVSVSADCAYSAILGGYGNVMTDSELGMIGGGTGNQLMAGGDYSAIGGGYNNSVASNNSFLGGGSGNFVGNPYAVLGGGYENTNNAYIGTLGGGDYNRVTGTFATVPGGLQASASLFGQLAHASGDFDNVSTGGAQASEYILHGVTTGATNSEIFLDGGVFGGKRMVMQTNTTWTFDILIVARASNGDSAGFHTNGVVKNVYGAIYLDGTSGGTSYVPGIQKDAGLASASATLTADSGHQSIDVKVAGNSSTNRWVVTVKTAEVRF